MTTMSHMLLMLVHMLNNFMVLVVTSCVLAIVMMVMDMSTSLMLFQMVNHVLVLMMDIMAMGMSRYFVM
jgi:hypothetical protein